MRAMESEMNVLQDVRAIVYSAFACITSDCDGWISDCGIYL